MKKIVQLFQKREEINTFEQKIAWREELLYLIENRKNADILLREIADTIDGLICLKENSDLENELLEKFNLFLKYFNKSKLFLEKSLFNLIGLSEKYLGEPHKVSILGKDFYCSQELSDWAKEIYYLMAKLEERIKFPLSTWWLVKKAKGVLTKEEKLKLEEEFRIFKDSNREKFNHKK